jgi:alpha-amylase
MSGRRVRGAVCALLVAALAAAPAAAAKPHRLHHIRSSGRDVVANLFEWNWASVAKECTTVLGPAGYGAVQVAPPQDSLTRSGHPWWEVYQPVDYNLTSRMGNEAQFRSMVATCRRAGVKVIVDAVINHMTGQGDTSYGGVHYSKYAYTGLYTPSDFHVPAGECPTGGDILDFNNYLQVTRCELVSLSDLRTETEHVRATLAAYLNKLIGYGVSGFRVDAAKHLGQIDLAAIEARLHRTADGSRPYIALEVPPGGPGKLSPWAFRGVGDLLGFDFAAQMHDAFKSYVTPPGGNITDLQVLGEDSGLLPSDKSLAFVENHDTERNGSTLSYVYASFAFTNSDDSPPSDANGFITNTDCANGWICTDRTVASLVGWHNYAGAAPQANWYDDAVNLIAFSRGNRAWIAINNETAPVTRTFATGLPRGRYCDVIHGDAARGGCTGPVVTVGSGGQATITVPAKDSVAIDGGDRD